MRRRPSWLVAVACLAAFLSAQEKTLAQTQSGSSGKWKNLYSDEQWYKEYKQPEQVFTGTLQRHQEAQFSALQRPHRYKLGDRFLYPARKNEELERLVGQKVEIRGKAYDVELEGQSVREIWPGAIRTAGSSPRQTPADKRPTKIWARKGPLGETPKRITDAFPLSDQQNQGKWVKFEPMSDEFDGKGLDLKKWAVGMYWWKGRQPALFSEKNVTVSDGKLHLTMRKEKVPAQFERLGYKDYTSAALHTKARSSYGYYEVKAKPMDSAGSSSFWFQQDETPGWGTEIDVFEIGGKAKGFEHKYHMTLHVTRTPQEKKHWSVGGVWIAPWRLADDYHVYGFDWGREELKFYVDGVLVRSVENPHWPQPLYLGVDF